MTRNGQHQRRSSAIRWLGAILVSTVIGLPSALAQTYTYQVLYAFTGGVDGASPVAGLIRDSAGNLYGTAERGGKSNNGVVFKVDTTGKETVLHRFTGGADGANPEAGLIADSAGNLYGTTVVGGTSNFGVLFKLDKTGETVLYSFTGGTDGKWPNGLIRDSAGNLYGTTAQGGGTGSNGVVFKLDTTGMYQVLYSFAGGADGSVPVGALIRGPAGNLFGSTLYGGGLSDRGVVFKLDTAGTETVLHRFRMVAQGGLPTAGLIGDSAGNLYATASSFGTSNRGVVFKLDATDTYQVLYSFTGGADGGTPYAALIKDSAGNLYGTTLSYGGTSKFGVVFKLDTTGTYQVLYSFTLGADGGLPQGRPNPRLGRQSLRNYFRGRRQDWSLCKL